MLNNHNGLKVVIVSAVVSLLYTLINAAVYSSMHISNDEDMLYGIYAFIYLIKQPSYIWIVLKAAIEYFWLLLACSTIVIWWVERKQTEEPLRIGYIVIRTLIVSSSLSLLFVVLDAVTNTRPTVINPTQETERLYAFFYLMTQRFYIWIFIKEIIGKIFLMFLSTIITFWWISYSRESGAVQIMSAREYKNILLKKYRATLIVSLAFIIIHAALLLSIYIEPDVSAEGQAFGLLYLYLPLIVILGFIPGGEYVIYSSNPDFIAFFSIAGTLMYGFFGAIVGLVIDKYRAHTERVIK